MAGATGRVETNVAPPAPYNITLHLSLFSIPGEPCPHVYSPGERRLSFLAATSSGYVPVDLWISGEPWSPEIRVVAHAGGAKGEEAVRLALEHVRAGFDYNEFARRARGIPWLAPLAARYPGVRPGRHTRLYDALVDTIVKQRVPLRVALRAENRLVARHGVRATVEGRSYYWLPPPSVLAGLGAEELRASGLSRLRARALLEVARAELEGRLPSAERAVEDPWGTVQELRRIYGVGPWTASLSIASVHPRFPLGPYTDLAVRRGLERRVGKPLTRSEMERALEALGDLASLALYLAALDYEMSKGGEP